MDISITVWYYCILGGSGYSFLKYHLKQASHFLYISLAILVIKTFNNVFIQSSPKPFKQVSTVF